MNFFRFFALLFCCLIGGSTTRAALTPSARKIGPVEVGYVESMAVSRDGRFLSVFSTPGEKGSNCTVIDRRTHASTQLSASSRIEPICFSRDGRQLWVWGLHLDEPLPGLKLKPSDQSFLALYDLRHHRYLRAFFSASEEAEVPSDGTLSRDGRTLVYASNDGWICGFNTRTGREMWRHRAQNKGDEPVSIELNGDGTRFLRTADDDNREAQSAQVVSIRSGRVLSTLRLPIAHPGAMMSAFSGAKFAPRGSQVAVFQSNTQQWVFFNSRTAKVQWKMGGPSRSSEGDLKWQWSPNARYVGVSGPRGFELREARSGRVLNKCAGFNGDETAFSPDGSRLYALARHDTGFGADTDLWQWRLFPTHKQRRADARFMRRLRAREERFAFSPRHINESLTLAARRGDAKRVAMLLNRGAYLETVDGHRETPLENAVFGRGQRSFATVKLLVARGANVNARGSSILASAAVRSAVLTKFLLDHGARVNDDASGYGTATALHAAMSFANLETARLLLQAGANANAKNAEGMTPLLELIDHIDSSFPTPKTVLPLINLLLGHGADVNAHTRREISDTTGQTALSMAAMRANVEVMRLLLDKDANPNAIDPNGETSLMHIASSFQPREDFPDPQREKDVILGIQLLAAHGAKMNLRNEAGATALSLAASPAIQAALRKFGAKS